MSQTSHCPFLPLRLPFLSYMHHSHLAVLKIAKHAGNCTILGEADPIETAKAQALNKMVNPCGFKHGFLLAIIEHGRVSSLQA